MKWALLLYSLCVWFIVEPWWSLFVLALGAAYDGRQAAGTAIAEKLGVTRQSVFGR